MRESALTKRILAELHDQGAKAIKTHGDKYMENGTADILGCVRGRCFVIECKVGKNVLSAIQIVRINQWRTAGAAAVVAREDFDTAAFVGSLRR